MINLSATHSKTYSVTDPILTWPNLAFTTQVPACDYAPQFDLNIAPPFKLAASFTAIITATNVAFTFYTRNLTEVDIRKITVTSTL